MVGGVCQTAWRATSLDDDKRCESVSQPATPLQNPHSFSPVDISSQYVSDVSLASRVVMIVPSGAGSSVVDRPHMTSIWLAHM
jgi:hypothetical protein